MNDLIFQRNGVSVYHGFKLQSWLWENVVPEVDFAVAMLA